MDTTAKSEEQFIQDIKLSIQDTTIKVSNRVITSAFAHLDKKECFNPNKIDEIKGFFVKKIPGVLASEISKELQTVLGLNLDLD